MDSASRSPSRPSHGDLITRLHLDALDTPTTLVGSTGIFSSRSHDESSSDESDFQLGKPNKPAPVHARSSSHPFPSFLTSPRSRQGAASQPHLNESKSGDGSRMNMESPNTANPKPKRNPVSSKDFVTGTCMTCGSLMRWPKELGVFRCTICATINDLEDPRGETPKLRFLGRRRDGSSQNLREENSYQPISIHHCQELVRLCIRSYFSNALRPRQHPKTPGEPVRVATSETSHSRGYLSPGYAPRYHFESQPTLRPGATPKAWSSSHPERPTPPSPSRAETFVDASRPASRISPTEHDLEPKRIFKRLEDYIIRTFSSYECVNSSFKLPCHDGDDADAERPRRRVVTDRDQSNSRELVASHDDWPSNGVVDQIDAKMLLLGDVAENGSWWTGGRSQLLPSKSAPSSSAPIPSKKPLAPKDPNIDWDELTSWYHLTINAAEDWLPIYEDVCKELSLKPRSQQDLQRLEEDLLTGQLHAQRVLLKAMELLLKRPGRRLTEVSDLRFVLIFAENPMLHPDPKFFRGLLQPSVETPMTVLRVAAPEANRMALPSSGLLSGQHSGIVKRLIGLISNSPAECHNQLISWLSKYDKTRFFRTKELFSGFLSYRLLRQIDKKQPAEVDITAGLIPEMRTGRSTAASYLHDEIRAENSSKKKEPEQKSLAYTEDWQVRAASRVLALLFAANNTLDPKHGDLKYGVSSQQAADVAAVGSTRDYRHKGGQLLPTSDFYNTMIDYADLVKDFETWESKRSRFAFCQYPFLMSIWAKTQILEHDARRQMQMKARDAFLDSIMTNRSVKQYLSLQVRRDCLVEDSLAAVSEVIGSGSEDVKKGLRITFKGEEGIDAGGLRKEWFLLLIREVFNPDHGMFLYDEDSRYCYFNPNTFETSDQFFLVGVVMGLAIYNSTILDVALPPFAFRKLLAAAPAHGLGTSSRPRPSMQYTLDDLAEYRPRIAHGLRQLLDFDGDVQSVFCLDFVIDTEKFGVNVQVPLCPGGEQKPVTNSNRREYVELYTRYLLDTAVTRQFEPFKRGFYTVCGGNAFSLFRPEEIELLIRGSDEALDIASLRAIAQYDNWGPGPRPDGRVDVVAWFWETFQEATPVNQRKLLSFITGSDRMPATGASMLPIKISCLGEDVGRFPIARTCFNMLSLWRYTSKERLEMMLWRAVFDSEGFGLK